MQGDKAIKATENLQKIADENLIAFYKQNREVIDEYRRLQKECSKAMSNNVTAKINQVNIIVANRKKPGKLF